MRAARLLQILLMLQNRGKMTAPALARELEVTPRTILRDIDAMSGAGLPVLTRRGSHGGIELGFNYRSRLTGLAADEAEALALWLATPAPVIAALGLTAAASRARAKLVESLPDRTRAILAATAQHFPIADITRNDPPDPRISAIASAIRNGQTLRLRIHSATPVTLVPTTLAFGPDGWTVAGPPLATPVPLAAWGDINISRALTPKIPARQQPT